MTIYDYSNLKLTEIRNKKALLYMFVIKLLVTNRSWNRRKVNNNLQLKLIANNIVHRRCININNNNNNVKIKIYLLISVCYQKHLCTTTVSLLMSLDKEKMIMRTSRKMITIRTILVMSKFTKSALKTTRIIYLQIKLIAQNCCIEYILQKKLIKNDCKGIKNQKISTVEKGYCQFVTDASVPVM